MEFCEASRGAAAEMTAFTRGIFPYNVTLKINLINNRRIYFMKGRTRVFVEDSSKIFESNYNFDPLFGR